MLKPEPDDTHSLCESDVHTATTNRQTTNISNTKFIIFHFSVFEEKYERKRKKRNNFFDGRVAANHQNAAGMRK